MSSLRWRGWRLLAAFGVVVALLRRLPRRSRAGTRVMLDTSWAHDRGGTGRYVRELRAALACEPDVEILTAGVPRVARGPRWLRVPLNGLTHLGWTQFALPLLAGWHRAGVIHCSMTAPIFAPCPVVVTLHDALDYLPDLRPSRLWSGYMRTVGALAGRRADAVLTGTCASAREIALLMGVDRERIVVTPYGTSLRQDDVAETPVAGPFVLLVGRDDRRKDIRTGLQAVRLVRESGVELKAVIAGVLPIGFEREPWVVVRMNVSDAELVGLYRAALAMLVPSRHEGFGLPVIEGLAFGTPVVASDIPALREVGGDAAWYAPVGDARAFAEALAEIVAAPEAARDRVARGVQHRDVSWRATARATVAVYRELAGRSR